MEELTRRINFIPKKFWTQTIVKSANRIKNNIKNKKILRIFLVQATYNI